MLLPLLSCLAVLALGDAASLPKPGSYVVHESRAAHQSSWRRGERLDSDAIIPLRIGLSQNNLDHGHGYLMNVSDPTSPKYGKHWTAEEVYACFAPKAEAVDAVKQWLVASGIEGRRIAHYENKGWLAIDLPASEAELLLQTEYHEHEHQEIGSLSVGCDKYHVPKDIQHHIDYITPGVKFSLTTKNTYKRGIDRFQNCQSGRPSRHHWNPPNDPKHPYHMPPAAARLPADLRDRGRNITPPCIKALYNIPNAYLDDSVNALGIFEDNQAYAQEDLDLYFSNYAPYVPNGTHPTNNIIDGARPVPPVPVTNKYDEGEPDIDFDMAYSLIYPQKITLYQAQSIQYPNGTNVDNGVFQTLLDAIDGSYCNYTAFGITGDSPGIDPTYPNPQYYNGSLQCGIYKPTRVIPLSYGLPEHDYPPNYLRRQCNEFMKLGLQGHSIFFASGDGGVAAKGDICLSGNGQNETIFNPDYSSVCPYVTSVGATQLLDNQTVYDPESAMDISILPTLKSFSSSGGFSNVFKRPSYQDTAVSDYFAAHDPGYPFYVANENASNIGSNGGIYNRAGRAMPDVSANGVNFSTFIAGERTHQYGTSLATPLWASIITLINEERTAVNKSSVGFINPVLYANPGVLKDITNGTNPGCGTKGFSAVEGWDPVTGLGTPKYPEMLKLFMSLP